MASFCSVLAIYSYHSSKVTVPLYFGFLFFKNFSSFKKKPIFLLIVGVLTLILLYPFLKDSFLGEGLSRASSMIFVQTSSALEIIKKIITNILSYFSWIFLISGKNFG
jgi:hypothetical protein